MLYIGNSEVTLNKMTYEDNTAFSISIERKKIEKIGPHGDKIIRYSGSPKTSYKMSYSHKNITEYQSFLLYTDIPKSFYVKHINSELVNTFQGMADLYITNLKNDLDNKLYFFDLIIDMK
jgi:hypothetical protein